MIEQLSHITFVTILLSLAGMLINAIALVQKRSSTTKFSFLFWAKKNWIYLALSTLSSIVLLIMADDVISLLGIKSVEGESFYNIYAFLTGLTGYSILRTVIKIIAKKAGFQNTLPPKP